MYRVWGLMSQRKILHNLACKIPVSKYLDFKEYLEALYHAMKSEMESYSYAQFSEDLGFAKTNILYLIIKGQRPLTPKNGKKIAEALGLKGPERKYWEDLVAYFKSEAAPEKEALFQNLVEQKSKALGDSDSLIAQLEFFTEWYHGAIYELSFTPAFTDEPKELANLLMPRIRVDQAKKSLALLQTLGLLAPDETTKKLRPTQAQITTGHEISSLAIVRYHQKMLELAKQALLTIRMEEREISATSMAVHPDKLPRIKREMRSFRKKILAIAGEDKDPERVYQMNIQFFPMTRARRPL